MKFNKAKIIQGASLAFIAGIAVLSYYPEISVSAFTFFIAAVVFNTAAFLFWPKKIIAVGLLLLGFISLGFWRYALDQEKARAYGISAYNGQTVELVGIVGAEPDIRESSTKLTTKIISADSEKADGLVLITVENYPQYDYGDLIKAECKLQAPEEFNGFAYDRYLGRYDIYSVCYYPKIELIAKDEGSVFLSYVYKTKNRLRQAVNSGLGEPHAVLLNAIILGDKKGLPADLAAAFSRSGLSHIIAISGMNISILVVIIMSSLMAIGLSRRQAFYFAVAFFAVYILLVGFPASALRAGVMGFLTLWAIYLGRLNRFGYALVLAAAVMLLFNPKLLRDDIGFQLSFLAMMGVAAFYPWISGLYANLKSEWARKCLDIINMTMSAQILTWPVITYNFSVFSIIAPVANLFVIWCLPFQMVTAMIAIVPSLVWPHFAFLFFFPAYLLTDFLIRAGLFFSRFPYAFIMIDNLTVFWLVIYYIASAVVLLMINRK